MSNRRKHLELEIQYALKKRKEIDEKLAHLARAKHGPMSDSDLSDQENLDFADESTDEKCSNDEDGNDQHEKEINTDHEERMDVETDKENRTVEKNLSDAIIAALGEDPLESKALPVDIHPNLIKRYAYIANNGLSKEDRDTLIKKYAIPEDLSTPLLNEQIQSKLKEKALKRDSYRLEDQKLVSSALTAICAALTMINSQDEEGLDQDDFIERLADSAKLIAGVQFGLSESRRAFIMPRFAKSFQDILKKTKQDQLLFGKDLATKIKEYKDSERLLKDSLPEVQPRSGEGSRNLGNSQRPLGLRTNSNRQGSSATGGQARPRLYFRRSLHQNRGGQRGRGYSQKQKNFSAQQHQQA